MRTCVGLLCISMLLLSSAIFAQSSKANTYRDPRKPVLRGKEEIEIVGTVVAHDRDGGVAVGFEGGYYDVLVVRIEKILKGNIVGHYVRADFSGWAVYETDPKMPTSFLYEGKPWRIKLHPPDSRGQECAYTVAPPVRPGDLLSDFRFGAVLVPVGVAKSFPDVNAMHCYTFTLKDLQ
jgi:hypothetical protein